MSKWKQISEDENEREEDPTMWKPETKGESRIGTLQEVDTEAGKFPGSVLYVFDGDSNNPDEHREVWKKWGCKQLNGLMKQIKMGQEVRVTYIDSHPVPKGNPWQEYTVEVADDGDEGGEPSSSSSKPEPKPQPEQKRKPVAGKLRFEANGIIKDMTSTLSIKDDMIPGHQDMKNEINRMFDDKELGGYQFKPRELHLAVLQILDETFKEYEDMIND